MFFIIYYLLFISYVYTVFYSEITLSKQSNIYGFTMMVKTWRNVGFKWGKIFLEFTEGAWRDMTKCCILLHHSWISLCGHLCCQIAAEIMKWQGLAEALCERVNIFKLKTPAQMKLKWIVQWFVDRQCCAMQSLQLRIQQKLCFTIHITCDLALECHNQGLYAWQTWPKSNWSWWVVDTGQ
jgi:hypothetical protein